MREQIQELRIFNNSYLVKQALNKLVYDNKAHDVVVDKDKTEVKIMTSFHEYYVRLKALNEERVNNLIGYYPDIVYIDKGVIDRNKWVKFFSQKGALIW